MKGKPGSMYNRQQGTQEPSVGKSRPAGSYSRSSQRAGASTSTTFSDSTTADKDSRDKKHNTGRYSRQRLFP